MVVEENTWKQTAGFVTPLRPRVSASDAVRLGQCGHDFQHVPVLGASGTDLPNLGRALRGGALAEDAGRLGAGVRRRHRQPGFRRG